jgi:pimeloyl-ACP methyl ester carboxylesterase
MMAHEDEWIAYYDQFANYFSPGVVRDGCYPRIMEHPDPTEKAIVLVHGLTDSPHFLTAIGEHFHERLGYNVYMPLLHCHGLKKPKGMEKVELDEWKANVRYAINTAAGKAERVSIGGLSTGGTLSFYMACTKPKITGDLYLFSAALDLAGGRTGVFGELSERLGRTFLMDLLDHFDNDEPLVGVNPYRYVRMDKDGAQELTHLIKETDDLLNGFDAKHPFPKRVFAAHSECDSTASIAGPKELERKTRSGDFYSFYIDKAEEVSHACLVLKDPVCSLKDGTVLEVANPVFDDMMEAITDFEKS